MSSEIQWSTAKVMIKEYWDSTNPLRIPVNGSGVQVLKGYRVNKADIDAIFNNGATELFIMFAVRPQDVGQSTQYVTTVLGGINGTNNLLTNKVYDMCDPCPNMCPSNFNTAVNS